MKIQLFIIIFICILFVFCSGQIKPRGHCVEKCIIRMLRNLNNINISNSIRIKDIHEMCEKLYNSKDSNCIDNVFERTKIE